ncbi:hypothetical protein [Nocardia sp. CS682]|uniref:hypothetical protein n=1 Tax=Nocardia sp. CS682 TaxID=1047172 RepID=UPI001074A2E0|nr:hypothetical protein [Nocardia sp. CS682]
MSAMGSSRTVGSLAFAALAAVGHHTLGLVIGAMVLVLAVLVPVLAQAISELFWLRALNKPENNLRWILNHAASLSEAERMIRLLRGAQRDILDARIKSGQSPRR